MSITKTRLDQLLAKKKVVTSRSKAEDLIKRGFVKINGKVILRPGYLVDENAKIELSHSDNFVSRAGEKLNSVKESLNLDFQGKTVLDVGSSTGGFTELVLRNGASKVIAVDVGTDQMHQSLRDDPRVELHEKTDIRNVRLRIEDRRLERESENPLSPILYLQSAPNIIVIDVSFISLRKILPHITTLMNRSSVLVAMVKPQFEASNDVKHKGVIKNASMRRNILKEFENWTQNLFKIVAKADSGVSGAKGNIERFYVLRQLKK